MTHVTQLLFPLRHACELLDNHTWRSCNSQHNLLCIEIEELMSVKDIHRHPPTDQYQPGVNLHQLGIHIAETKTKNSNCWNIAASCIQASKASAGDHRQTPLVHDAHRHPQCNGSRSFSIAKTCSGADPYGNNDTCYMQIRMGQRAQTQ